MPGYTHLQRAQPTTFAHYMMAYANMLRRDVTRLEDCLERHGRVPPGRGRPGRHHLSRGPRSRPPRRWASTSPPTTPWTAYPTGTTPSNCSPPCSILMMHLSRFSEEIILWCSWEFKFVELDDAYSTGSSIMPQKKNPDVAELVRGKTGRVYGDLVTLLTVMKGLPLAYNKDMQEDKEAALRRHRHGEAVPARVRRHGGHPDGAAARTCAKAAAGGFINATDCADYLVKKGMPFREAYMIVGRLVNMLHQDRGDAGHPDPEGLPGHLRLFDERCVPGAGAEDLRQRPQGLRRPGRRAWSSRSPIRRDAVRSGADAIPPPFIMPGGGLTGSPPAGQDIERNYCQSGGLMENPSILTARRAPPACRSMSGSAARDGSGAAAASTRTSARTRRSGRSASTRRTWSFCACPTLPPWRRWP